MRPILLAALALLVTAVPAEAKRRPFCDARPGFTLADDGSHRVYETIVPVKSDPDADVTTLLSCRSGTRRKSDRLQRYQNNLDSIARVKRVALAGRYALLTITEETGVTFGYAARVLDLRKGRRVGGGLYVDGSDGFSAFLSATGGFAVRLRGGELRAYDSAGERTLAPKSTDVAIAGSRLYWTNPDATPASTELAAPPTTDFAIE
jgi:hypothetical protein